MKRGLLSGVLIFLFLYSICFASAFSFSENLSFIDPTLITLALLFVVIFAVLYFALSKFFKGSPAIPSVLAISMSLLSVYWINSLASIATIFSGLGISDNILYTIGPILFIVLTIFLFIKIRFGVLLLFGGIMILIAITGLAYSSDILIVIGIVFVSLGFLWMFSKRGRIYLLRTKYNRMQGRNPRDIRLNKIANDLLRLGYDTRKISY